MIYGIAFLGGVFLASFCLLFLWRQTVPLSSAEAALVIRKGNPSRVVFGDFVLMPFFERWEKIPLREQFLSFSFENETALHSANGQKMNIEIELVFSSPRERKKIKRILDEHGIVFFRDSEVLISLVRPVVHEQLPLIVKKREAQEWINHERKQIQDDLEKALRAQDLGCELTAVCISKIRSTDQEYYDPNNIEDKKGLLSFQEEVESLVEIERERERILEKKRALEEEKKELQHKILEIQSEISAVDRQNEVFLRHVAHLRQEMRIQIDLLKSHLDVELAEYRREAAQQAALLGKTSPESVERESAKLRNRLRIEADTLKREQEDIFQQIDNNTKD